MIKPVKFLILRFSSIGDIVLTTPVLRCLKEQYPHAEVHYFTKSKFGFILKDNPFVDKLWLLDKSESDVLKLLKKENFDFIIDLHNNLRTAKIKFSLGKPSFSFDKLNVQKFLLTNFKINRLPDVHIVDRYLDTLKTFDIKNDLKGLDYFVPEKDQIEIGKLPVSHQTGFIAYAIGGQHFTKKLPVTRMIELCTKINQPLVLLGGKEDFNNGEEVKNALPEIAIYNACGAYNFNQSASVIEKAKVVFSHDTGLMHVASAFHKKVYSIWGNTVPEFGMYPYQTSFEILENKELNCRPCSKIGHKQCPKKHFKCMNELPFSFEVDQLLQ
ncbi:glycosyl transferase [Dyadobacter luteus]|uniref:Glycosyl transferase n=1 Tax=Dyadobacter luteus TaxID=2259619 RepID=A0A3D8YAK9_9BACT|nr:glycosyltransferase family 9 protein [Dyadobacter luteus]REA60709.1 glycosyl transferase [Dyadobacter luteus]